MKSKIFKPLFLVIFLCAVILAPVCRISAQEKGEKGIYEDFLHGDGKVYLRENALEEVLSDEYRINPEGYTLQDILALIWNDSGYLRWGGKISEVQYAYLDCGRDGCPELAIRLVGMDIYSKDDYSTVTLIIFCQNDRLELCYGFQTWARSETTLYANGVMMEGGSNGAVSHSYDCYYLDGSEKKEIIYTSVSIAAGGLRERAPDDYLEIFTAGTNVEDPCMDITTYQIGGLAYTVYGIGETEPEKIKRCETFIAALEQQGQRFYTEGEIEEFIRQQMEQSGIGDTWQERRIPKWNILIEERNDAYVIPQGEKIEQMISDFLEKTALQFAGTYHEPEMLYRQGILFFHFFDWDGEVLQFFTPQPCAVYDGRNVGDRQVRNSDSNIEILLPEHQDYAVFIVWEAPEKNGESPAYSTIKEIAYVRFDLKGQAASPSLFRWFEDDYRTQQEFMDGIWLESPNRTKAALVSRGTGYCRYLMIKEEEGEIDGFLPAYDVIGWIGEEHLIYINYTGNICLLHLEDMRTEEILSETVREFSSYDAEYSIKEDYLYGKSGYRERFLWEIVTDGPDVKVNPVGFWRGSLKDLCQVQAIIVEKGDCLWTIAEKYYGSGQMYSVIYQLNREEIGDDPSLIREGTLLMLYDK